MRSKDASAGDVWKLQKTRLPEHESLVEIKSERYYGSRPTSLLTNVFVSPCYAAPFPIVYDVPSAIIYFFTYIAFSYLLLIVFFAFPGDDIRVN